MLYLATASGPSPREAMLAGHLGQICTPPRATPLARDGHHVPWALDNGCFSEAWDQNVWLTSLDRLQHVPHCLFAVVPDVVADARATNQLWARWHGAVRNRGYRCAYVGQNGATTIPASAGALFVGGDTAWKLGPDARRLVTRAKRAGLWVHMGRVNSLRRLRYAADIGCDSADGTFVAFGPDVNTERLLGWVNPDAPGFHGVG